MSPFEVATDFTSLARRWNRNSVAASPTHAASLTRCARRGLTYVAIVAPNLYTAAPFTQLHLALFLLQPVVLLDIIIYIALAAHTHSQLLTSSQSLHPADFLPCQRDSIKKIDFASSSPTCGEYHTGCVLWPSTKFSCLERVLIASRSFPSSQPFAGWVCFSASSSAGMSTVVLTWHRWTHHNTSRISRTLALRI